MRSQNRAVNWPAAMPRNGVFWRPLIFRLSGRTSRPGRGGWAPQTAAIAARTVRPPRPGNPAAPRPARACAAHVT
jgi:hypothetical protein